AALAPVRLSKATRRAQGLPADRRAANRRRRTGGRPGTAQGAALAPGFPLGFGVGFGGYVPSLRSARIIDATRSSSPASNEPRSWTWPGIRAGVRWLSP